MRSIVAVATLFRFGPQRGQQTEIVGELFCCEGTEKVGAGFPSPATDYIEDDVDLNHHLIKNSPATFIIRVQGKSMNSVGIYDGDLLIVDRSINPKNLSTVIANVNDELVVKTILKEKGETFLTSGSKKKSERIHLAKDQEVIIWGVVTYVIHQVHN